MTDGVTQAGRDSDLIKKVDSIRELREKFDRRKSLELAEEIIDNLLELKEMENGYYNQINYKAILNDLNKYGTYLSSVKKDK